MRVNGNAKKLSVVMLKIISVSYISSLRYVPHSLALRYTRTTSNA